jgi:hypothetical protein
VSDMIEYTCSSWSSISNEKGEKEKDLSIRMLKDSTIIVTFDTRFQERQ